MSLCPEALYTSGSYHPQTALLKGLACRAAAILIASVGEAALHKENPSSQANLIRSRMSPFYTGVIARCARQDTFTT